ncbi:MAG: hypothetical protein RR322_01845, partial [Oscillospiraceae bacterium]
SKVKDVDTSLSQSSTIVSSSSQPSSSSEASSSSEPSSSEAESSKPEEQSSKPIVNVPKVFTISKSGEYADKEEYPSVVITADNVILKNKVIKGDLTLNCPKSKGYVDLIDSTVLGNIYINSGSQAVTLDNVIGKELKIISADGVPTVEIRNATNFNKTYIYSGAVLRESNLVTGNSGFTDIGVGGFKTTAYHNISFENVMNSYLTVNYPANINLLGNTRIKEVYAYKKCYFYGAGSMDYLYCKADGVSYNKVNTKIINMEGHKAISGGTPIGNKVDNTVDNAEDSKVENVVGKLNTPVISDIPIIQNLTVGVSFDRVKNATSYTIVTYKNSSPVKTATIKEDGKQFYTYFSENDYKTGDYVYFKVTATAKGTGYENSDAATSYAVTIA